MLAQPKLLSWAAAKTRVINQLHYTANTHDESRRTSLAPKIPQVPLFASRVSLFTPSLAGFSLCDVQPLTKFQFDAHLQAFTYYRLNEDDEDSAKVEDVLITSLFYDDPKDPRSAVFVYFTSLTTGVIRRCLK